MVFGALVSIASIGTYAIVEAGLHEINHAVNQANLLGPAATTELTGNSINGPINMLIVGVDASGERTDSIIIAHIPASHDRVYLISLPRDTKVNVPGGGTNKINSTFNSGFAEPRADDQAELRHHVQRRRWRSTSTASRTSSRSSAASTCTSTRPPTRSTTATSAPTRPTTTAPVQDRPEYRRADLLQPALQRSTRTADECTLPGIHEVVYPKGMYHFNAYDALDFVRCRDGLVGTDYARQRHQQQFIKAVMEKAYAQGPVRPDEAARLRVSR